VHIVGTAGHVDHGKSSLVLALTGHNPDRLIEEQERGMTLDLGFAPLRFPDGVEAGIIDVPGHERFLHNMLAGAVGMDLLLLVIAANEGPKQQTHEHLQIVNYLNAQRAIVVLTKIDLIQSAQRGAMEALAQAACRGTVAEGAPLVAVSVRTGEGLEALKAAIHDALTALPPRRRDAPAFMPVDRVFALPGHGTIITGTLLQGTIRSGDTLVLQPSGLPARIRGLQTFGNTLAVAYGGTRVAVNLPGIEVSQVARGETLAAARQFEPQQELAIAFSPLASALPLLRRRTPIRAHIGSAEIPGTLRFGATVPTSTAAVQAQVTLARPTIAFPGMRLILRRMSPKDLLGGGIVRGDVSPADAGPPEEFAHAPSGTREIEALLQKTNLEPLGIEKIAARANMLIGNAQAALAWLVESGKAVELQKPAAFVGARSFEAAWQHLLNWLRGAHHDVPWKVGVSTKEVAAQLAVSQTLASQCLHAWQDDGRIASRAGTWHLPDFSPSLTRAQRAFFDNALALDPTTPFLPHSFTTLTQAAGRARDLSEALDALFAIGALLRIGDDVYRRSQVESAKTRIAGVIAKNGAATMAQLRDALGTSRKYSLPLMEYLDSTGFTIRDGDLRRLRGK